MIFDNAANKVLSLIAGRAASINFGTIIYIGLSTTSPVKDGSNITEPVGNGYARVPISKYGESLSLKMSDPAAGAGGVITNEDTIFFPKATGAWNTITHAVIFDALTGGNPIVGGALGTSKSPVANQVTIIEPGELDISLT